MNVEIKYSKPESPLQATRIGPAQAPRPQSTPEITPQVTPLVTDLQIIPFSVFKTPSKADLAVSTVATNIANPTVNDIIKPNIPIMQTVVKKQKPSNKTQRTAKRQLTKLKVVEPGPIAPIMTNVMKLGPFGGGSGGGY